jgi:hypothetical protein
MRDIKNPALIFAKGILFFFTGIFAAALLLLQAPNLTIALLLLISIWAFCRFYYFAFYVVEHYVDPTYRFSGLLSFAQYVARRNRHPAQHDKQHERIL